MAEGKRSTGHSEASKNADPKDGDLEIEICDRSHRSAYMVRAERECEIAGAENQKCLRKPLPETVARELSQHSS